MRSANSRMRTVVFSVIGVCAVILTVLISFRWLPRPAAELLPSFDVHHVTYELSGNVGAADVVIVGPPSYGELRQSEHTIWEDGTRWNVKVPSGQVLYISAQAKGELRGTLSCRITVDGVIRIQQTQTGNYVTVECRAAAPSEPLIGNE